MNDKTFLIVGLGNPGEKYSRNRHNVGFMAVDVLGSEWNLKWQQQFKSLWAKCNHDAQVLYLQKPPNLYESFR